MAAYKQAVREGGKFPPLANLSGKEVSNGYCYCYVPLLLLALEKHIGEARMWRWLQTLLKYKNPVTNYRFFKNSLRKSGVTPGEMSYLEEQFLRGEGATTMY